MSNHAAAAESAELFGALASAKRLEILRWLKDPGAHFPRQGEQAIAEGGVSVLAIAEKLGVSQPTATVHLQKLARGGLVTAARVGQWTFYRRNEPAIDALIHKLRNEI